MKRFPVGEGPNNSGLPPSERVGTAATAVLPFLREGLDTISPFLKQSLTRIHKMLYPFEEFARANQNAPAGDQVALYEILTEGGAFTPALIAEIGIAGDDLFQYSAKGQMTKYHLRTTIEAANIHNALIQKGVNDTDSIRKYFNHNGWVLQSQMVLEIIQHSFVESLKYAAELRVKADRQAGFADFANYMKEYRMTGFDNTNQGVVVDWFNFAEGLSRQKNRKYPPVTLPHGITVPVATSELKHCAFDDSVAITLKNVDLPGMRWMGESIMVTIPPIKKLEALAICELEFHTASGIPLASGFLSRLTGEISLSGSLTVPATRVFNWQLLSAGIHYQHLRDSVVAAIYTAWTTGDILERGEVSFDNDSIVMPAVESIVAPAVEPATEPMIKPTIKPTIEPTIEPTIQLAVESTIKPTSQSTDLNQSSPVRIEEKRRLFSWLRVMSAFRRCGILVELDHAHPKLRYGEFTASYINRHEKEPKRNQKIVKNVLKTLGVDYQTFLLALK